MRKQALVALTLASIIGLTVGFGLSSQVFAQSGQGLKIGTVNFQKLSLIHI